MINKLMYIFLSALFLHQICFAQNSNIYRAAVPLKKGFLTLGRLQYLLPPPLISVSDSLLCAGESAQLYCSDPQSYFLDSEAKKIATLFVKEKGTYFCIYRGIFTPFYKDSLFVDVRFAPQVELFRTDTLVPINTVLNLSTLASVKHASGAVRWYDTLDNLLSNSYVVQSRGVLYAYVEDSVCNLSDEKPFTIELTPSFLDQNFFKVVNLVSVNNPQTMAYFKILNLQDFSTISLHLYTSKGHLIYHNANYKNEYEMSQLSEGVYYYSLRGYTRKGQQVNKNSFVQLIKTHS
ncbi:MAG: gliding motility-associated C-terminal domain-containing protein [Bacteroidales bacterium]